MMEFLHGVGLVFATALAGFAFTMGACAAIKVATRAFGPIVTMRTNTYSVDVRDAARDGTQEKK